jgi:hypothetical protein
VKTPAFPGAAVADQAFDGVLEWDREASLYS